MAQSEESASPRNPNDDTCARSSKFVILEVKCFLAANGEMRVNQGWKEG